MNNQEQSWEDKIRQDYKGIISGKQIEATIKYWKSIIKISKQQEQQRILGLIDKFIPTEKEIDSDETGITACVGLVIKELRLQITKEEK